MTSEEMRIWFPSQMQGRSEQEKALPSYMYDVLDRIRSGRDPYTNAALSSEEQERLLRAYLPLPLS